MKLLKLGIWFFVIKGTISLTLIILGIIYGPELVEKIKFW